LFQFSDAPRRHVFAADAILELTFTFDHEDAEAIVGEHLRERSAAEAAAYDELRRSHNLPSSLVPVRANQVPEHRRTITFAETSQAKSSASIARLR
jgi:hypothetical protein